MLIDRTTAEDLSMLDLLVSKLEENMATRGIKVFDAEKDELTIDAIVSDEDDFSSRELSGYIVDSKSEFKPVKRIKLMFNSKADFRDRYAFERKDIVDDGIYTASFLHITWDYVTCAFFIHIGTDLYEKDLQSKNNTQKRAYKSDTQCLSINLNFGLKYRRDIQLIKIRLGKLYSKLVIDRKTEKETWARKQLIQTAITTFPDLIDPLILGGSLNEKRNSRGIPSEGRTDSEDSF